MRVEVADSAVEFAKVLLGADLFQLAVPAINEYVQFLADGCRGGCMSVRMGEHRNIFFFLGHCGNGVNQFLRFRQPDVFNAVFQH